MTDTPMEAAARAIHNERIKGLQNCYGWDESGLDDERPGYRDTVYRDAEAAVTAYLAALSPDIPADAERRGAEAMRERAAARLDLIGGFGGEAGNIVRALPLTDTGKESDDG